MATKIVVPAQVRPSFPITLGVQTDLAAPYKYHWRRNGALLGAPSQPCYTINELGKADIGAKFSVTVFGETATETSPDIILALGEPGKPAVAASGVPPYARGAATPAPAPATTIPPYAKRS